MWMWRPQGSGIDVPFLSWKSHHREQHTFQKGSLGGCSSCLEILQLLQSWPPHRIEICGCQKIWKKLLQQAVCRCPLGEDLEFFLVFGADGVVILRK